MKTHFLKGNTEDTELEEIHRTVAEEQTEKQVD